jgi:predicted nucleic acid-binding protein
MIILDTNVVSEPLKLRPSPEVLDWFDRQAEATLYLTAPGLSEVLAGVALLPAGRKRSVLQEGFDELIGERIGTPILPFDAESAIAYASTVAAVRAAGQSVSVLDGQIAAIALVHGFAVATRDAAPFQNAGVPVIDPWQATAA